jgi:transposase
VSGRFELTDAEYTRIAPLLPPMTPQRGGRWRDRRQVINGILFRVRTGVPWRDVPERYGPWKRCTSGSPGGRRTAPGRATVQIADIAIWLRAKPDRRRAEADR